MRKVTQSIVAAFINGTAKSSGNTSTDGNTLFLHGHPIARKVGVNGLEISLAGWGTVTTRERVNGVLSAINHPARVFQRAHEQFIGAPGADGRPLDTTEWVRVKAA